MSIDPDSALAVISATDTASLCPDCRHRRDLITVKAKSKAYISIVPDTGYMKSAMKHFAGRGDSLEIQSIYYYGEALREGDRLSEALIVMHDAYDLASTNADHFYAAMTARSLNFIYGDLLIMSKALEWACIAREEFAKAKKTIHEEWMKATMAEYYLWNGEFEAAHLLLDSVDLSSPKLHAYTVETRAELFVQQKLHAKALEQWFKLKELRGKLRSRQWSIIGEELYHMEDYTGALVAMDSARAAMNNQMDSMYVNYLSGMIAGANGNYREGFESTMEFAKEMMHHNENDLMHPKNLMLTDYFKLRAEYHRKEALQTRKVTAATISITILVVIILIFIIRDQRRRIRERRDSETDLLLRLKALKDEISNHREESAENLKRLTSINNTLSKTFKSELDRLLEQRFGLIDELCGIWYENPEGSRTDPQFRKRVVNLLTQFRSEENLNEIELLIDHTYDGWMTHFRSLYPDLSSQTYTLVIYLFIGLSPQTITMLMGKSRINTVHVMRSRLKTKLTASNPEVAEDIIARLKL